MCQANISATLTCTLALGLFCLDIPAAPAAALTGNIPTDRLADETYRSPDGNFTLALPNLASPGAKAEERIDGDVGLGVFFVDDFGTVYYVLRTDNSRLKYDLQKIADGYVLSDALREKEIVATDRGSELRLAGVIPGGSPLVRETTIKRKTVRQKLDLHQAISLFVADPYIFEVAAGVTATQGEPDVESFLAAKRNLEVFLAGLKIGAVVAAP